MLVVGPSNAPLKTAKEYLGFEDAANRVRLAVEAHGTDGVVLVQHDGDLVPSDGPCLLRVPFRPWYPKKQEPSFADILTTLRRVSYEEKTEGLLPKQCRLKTWIAQLTELLSRAG